MAGLAAAVGVVSLFKVTKPDTALVDSFRIQSATFPMTIHVHPNSNIRPVIGEMIYFEPYGRMKIVKIDIQSESFTAEVIRHG